MITQGLRGRMRPRTARSGQAIVEFAMIAPILLLMVFGLIDFARAWSAHHVIADAAREGARIAVVDNAQGVNDARSAIQNRMQTAGLNANEPVTRITFDPADGNTGRGEPLTVDIEHDFDFWLLGPLMKWALGGETAQLATRITMRTE